MTGHGAINPQRFPARSRMNTNEGVSPLHILWPRCWVITVQIWVCGPVDGVLAVDHPAEPRRQLLVGGVSTSPERVAADWRDGIVVQVRHAGGLLFVHEIRVPARGAAGLAEAGFYFGRLEGWPDYRDARDTGDLGDLWLYSINEGSFMRGKSHVRGSQPLRTIHRELFAVVV